MIKEVKNTINTHKLLEKGDTIVVGLSGGPDSVCLFHVLHKLKSEYAIKLHIVHVNHQLRPVICDEEQAFVEELCRKWETPCYSFKIDCNAMAAETGMSGEEAGRAARYKAFREVAERVDPQNGKLVKIAVAHNLEDQAETVLLRIIRGTGTDGLAGMGYIRQGEGNTAVIRPLLDISRHEIEDYLVNNHLDAKRDHTNLEPIYKRNKVRLELIPLLKEKYNENIIEVLARLANNAWMDREYLRARAAEGLASALKGQNTYDCRILKEMAPSLRRRAVVMALADRGLEQDITAVHLNAIDRLIDEDKTGVSIDLPHGYTVRTEYGNVILNHRVGKADDPIEKQADENLRAAMEEIGKHLAFDNDMQIRTRRDGDRIELAGVGRKKIQDFFVDAKVPREKRDKIPLVVRGNEVIAILGDDFLKALNSGAEPSGLDRGRTARGYKIKFEEGGKNAIEQTS